MALSIPREHFLFLHQQLIDACKKRCEAENESLPTKIEQLYGFGEGLDTPNSIKKLMLKTLRPDPQIPKKGEKLPPINSKWLYLKKKRLDADKTIRTVRLTGNNATVYFLFLGFKNYQEFAEAFLIASTLHTRYTTYYYSTKRYAIGTFELQIDYEATPFKVWEKGFHDVVTSRPEYSGTAKQVGNNLYINLEDTQGYEMKIIAFTGLNENKHPKEQKILFGVLLGVSINERIPITMECILVQEAEQLAAEKLAERQKFIHRYLMLKRNCFRGHKKSYDDLSKLTANGNWINKIDHMVGNFRIWSYSHERQTVTQSKFEIRADYSSYLHTGIYAAGQNTHTCLLNTHSAVNEELCVSAHPENSIKIMYYAIIDIPAQGERFTDGVFSSVGVENNPSKCSYIALYQDDTPFEPEILDQEKIELLTRNNKALEELWKRLWKHEVQFTQQRGE